jgi:hypothetical protein
MATVFPPPPVATPFLDQSGKVSLTWIQWFQRFQGFTNELSTGVRPVAEGGTGRSTVPSGDLLLGGATPTDPLTVIAPGALTKTDDTNVSLTLGGTPSSALVRAVSLTLGWLGLLGLARGGTAADLSATGGPNQYLKQATSGGVVSVGILPAASGHVAGKTSAQTLVTYTVGAADALFRVGANIEVTTSTTHNITVTVAYTTPAGAGRTLTLNFTQVAGAAFLTNITNVTGAGSYEGVAQDIRCKAATTITIATAGTFTTITYDGDASVLPLS